jgi:hypothetical protein
VFAWLSGCLSDAVVAASMEEALAASNDAVAAALVATELRIHAHEAPDVQLRHATSCGCPCRTKTGEGDFFVMDLDYHAEGCLPVSGLVAGGISGVIVLEVDGPSVRASTAAGGLGGRPMGGVLEGRVAGSEVESLGSLEAGDHTLGLDVRASWEGGRFAVTGDVEVDGLLVSLDGVELGWTGLASACPTPEGGVATVAGDHEVTVTFGEDGLALAALGRHTSEPTDPCGYASDLY